MTDQTPQSSDHWQSYKRPALCHVHQCGAISYLTKNALSINEGGTPINFHLRWRPFKAIYLFILGKRWFWVSEVPDA